MVSTVTQALGITAGMTQSWALLECDHQNWTLTGYTVEGKATATPGRLVPMPIQFSMKQPLVLQPSVKVSLPLTVSLKSSELDHHSKRARIVPKVLLADDGTTPLPTAELAKKEKLFREGLSPLFPVQSRKEEEI